MRNILFKGLVVALLAGAALSVSVPSFAAERDRDRPRVHRGDGHRVVVGHGPRRHVVRMKRFRHGPVVRLSIGERDRWRHGRWWQGRRHGRVGWWWLSGGIWYWYPAAVYPYPAEISTTAVYDYAPEGRSDDSWYYCEDPQGYYPYIQSCNVDWKPVPIQPQAMSDDGAYGEPPYTGEDEEGADDEGSYDGEDGPMDDEPPEDEPE